MSEDTNVNAQGNGERMDSDSVTEIRGSLDVVNTKEVNHKHGYGMWSVAEDGKYPNEISQSDPNDTDNDGKEVNEDENKTKILSKFVWGKIKNNPWWPGQIYDPSDASDYAKKLQKSEKLLVAFFGDGSFSWCSKSQLKPFVENFEKMSKQNSSRKLKHAVEEALNEIGRIVESKIKWSYMYEKNRSAFVRPLAVNAGIKKDVMVPEYDLSEIPSFEPAKIITLVKNIAKTVSVSCMLELTVLKSVLSAFNHAKGKNDPTMFYEPHATEGLVDVSNPMLGSFTEDSVLHQHEFDELNQPWLRKCEEIETDKLKERKRVNKSCDKDPTEESVYLAFPLQHVTRKRKKNEILDDFTEEKENAENGSKNKVTRVENCDQEETVSVPAKDKKSGSEKLDKITKKEIGNVAVSRDEEDIEKVDRSTKWETKNVAASEEKRTTRSSIKGSKGNGDEAPNHRGDKLPSQLQKTRKRTNNEKLELPEIEEEKEGTKMETDDKVFDNQETDNVRELRERKKSMYLSPPFLNFHPKNARMGERLTRVAGQVFGSAPNMNNNTGLLQNNSPNEVDTTNNASPNPSPRLSKKQGKEINDQILSSTPALKSSNGPSHDNLSNEVVTYANAFSKEEEKKIMDSVRINLSMEKVVSEIRSAALNPLVLWDKNFLETVEGFIFAYRNLKYLSGSYDKIYHNAQQGKKCNSVKSGSKLAKQNDENIGEEASKPVSLVVIFPPGFCLPSKADLITIFSNFGTVNEMETDVSHECYYGKIVFLSYSDTVKAFNTCLEKSPFGSAKVSYRLRYSAGSKKADENVKKPGSAEFEGSCLLFLKQKLEIMTSMVDNCRGNMSSELMVKLGKETKGLLDNINSVAKSSSA